MRNQISQTFGRGERDLGVNRPGGHDMDPAFARLHVIDIATFRFAEEWHRSDPYLARAAIDGQVASPVVPASAEVQAFAAQEVAVSAPIPQSQEVQEHEARDRVAAAFASASPEMQQQAAQRV